MTLAQELVVVESAQHDAAVLTPGSRLHHDYFEITCDFGNAGALPAIRPDAEEHFSAVATVLEGDSFE